MQRLRVKFGRGQELEYISHLDLMRLWERALRRAGMPIAYSQGFNPRPRLSIAAPLPIRVTSEGDLIDIFLERRASISFFTKAVAAQLPPGIEILEVKEIWPNLPSLQSQVRYAEYRVDIESDRELKEVQLAIQSLLGSEHLPWQHVRDKQVRKYDLRALIHDLWIEDWHGTRCNLGMRLRTDSEGAGRPEQVTLALGFAQQPQSIHRTKLILAGQAR
jgi:radical SAM-linked protein